MTPKKWVGVGVLAVVLGSIGAGLLMPKTYRQAATSKTALAVSSTYGGSSLPTMNGIAYKWSKKPDCGYLPCFGMTVRADEIACPNGVYAEINLLDRHGMVVGYSNDVVGALARGQKAKLIFSVTEKNVKRAEVNAIVCR